MQSTGEREANGNECNVESESSHTISLRKFTAGRRFIAERSAVKGIIWLGGLITPGRGLLLSHSHFITPAAAPTTRRAAFAPFRRIPVPCRLAPPPGCCRRRLQKWRLAFSVGGDLNYLKMPVCVKECGRQTSTLLIWTKLPRSALERMTSGRAKRSLSGWVCVGWSECECECSWRHSVTQILIIVGSPCELSLDFELNSSFPFILIWKDFCFHQNLLFDYRCRNIYWYSHDPFF